MKKYSILCSIGIVCGFILGSIMLSFDISRGDVLKYCLIASGGILLASIIINGSYNYNFNKKLIRVSKILTEELNPEKYISESKALLEKAKGKTLRKIIKINIATGFIYLENYEKAKEILLEINFKSLYSITRFIYQVNLAGVYFYLNEENLAIEIMEKCKKELKRYEKHPRFGSSIMVIRIFKCISEKKHDEAKELLNLARQGCTDKRLLQDYLYLEEKLSN